MDEGRESVLDQLQLEEAEQTLSRKLAAVLAAIDHCLEANLTEPSLILLYATVDAMAWLNRPPNQPDVERADFLNWVKKYLLPDSTLPCVAEDLYGARCGLLHTNTGESRLHRQLKATKLFYHRKRNGGAESIVQLRMNEVRLPLSIDLDVLVASFRQGLDRFAVAIGSDAELRQLVMHRIWGLYYSEVEMLYR